MTYIHADLVSTQQVAQHLDDPRWVVIDCRFDLTRPEWGFNNYQQSHIPHALFADLDKDLAGPRTPQTGRHPLPDPTEFTRVLSAWGIHETTQVVVYDTSGGSFAVRLWWLLHYYGHPATAVLDGGFTQWNRENRPVSSDVESRPPAQFEPHLQPGMLATVEDVEKIRLDPHYRLIDARSPIRYRGEQEPIDPVAGHIPGAVNRFHGSNLNSDGKFLPADQLKQQFSALLGGVPAENAIIYCGSGVTSIHHLLAMRLARLGSPRIYIGSWSEWIRDPERPIATGPQ